MNPHLFAQSGPAAGQRFELAPGVTTLGREAGNTHVIADQTVSRNHARITVVAGVATLEDAGSSGGTFVNDARIGGPTILRVGDTIRLGGVAFAFVPGTSVSPMGVTATMPSRSGRRREVGSAEAAAPMPVTPQPAVNNPGCMPDFSEFAKSMEGCLPWLIRALIVLVIVGVLVAIVGGIILCAGAGIGTLGAAAGASGGGTGQHSAGGSSGGAPPPADQQQQQQQQQQHEKRPANGSIKILGVKCAYLPREGYHAPVPVVLVSWQNVGSDPVIEVFADITVYDKGGAIIGVQKGVRIYTGAAVPQNSSHSDNEQTEGESVTLDQGKEQAMDRAVVTPTEVRVEAVQPSDDQ